MALTVKELVAKLKKLDPETKVVVSIHDHCSDSCAHSVEDIDLGWMPSGVVSLTLDSSPDMY